MSSILSVLLFVVVLSIIGVKWFRKAPTKSTVDINKMPIEISTDGFGGSVSNTDTRIDG